MHRYDNPWYVNAFNDWLGLFQGYDVVDKAFGVIIGLVAAGIAGFALYWLFRLVDQVGTPKQSGTGRIVKKWIQEGYWQETTESKHVYSYSEGKYVWASVPGKPVWVPPQPKVKIALDETGATDTLDVGDADYDVTREKEQVLVTYQRGRLFGATYIRSYMQAT